LTPLSIVGVEKGKWTGQGKQQQLENSGNGTSICDNVVFTRDVDDMKKGDVGVTGTWLV
jgi:hypothetical protein